MAYTKQGFKNGQTLNADNLIAMEDGILACAPAGYGLGGAAAYADDFDTALIGGIYYYNSSTANRPTGLTSTGVIFVENHADAQIWQTVKDTAGKLLRRVSTSTVPGEWEWDNPPMALGVEYRTTERWNGKPVYTVLTSCGAIGASITNVDTIIPTSATVIRHADTIGNMSLPFTYGSTELRCEYNNGASVKMVVMYGTSDFSTRAVMSQAWYAKA